MAFGGRTPAPRPGRRPHPHRADACCSLWPSAHERRIQSSSGVQATGARPRPSEAGWSPARGLLTGSAHGGRRGEAASLRGEGTRSCPPAARLTPPAARPGLAEPAPPPEDSDARSAVGGHGDPEPGRGQPRGASLAGPAHWEDITTIPRCALWVRNMRLVESTPPRTPQVPSRWPPQGPGSLGLSGGGTAGPTPHVCSLSARTRSQASSRVQGPEPTPAMGTGLMASGNGGPGGVGTPPGAKWTVTSASGRGPSSARSASCACWMAASRGGQERSRARHVAPQPPRHPARPSRVRPEAPKNLEDASFLGGRGTGPVHAGTTARSAPLRRSRRRLVVGARPHGEGTQDEPEQ